MEKPIIVLDVDGVILDFIDKFADYHNNVSHVKLSKNPQDWNFGVNKEYEPQLFKHMKKFIDDGQHLELFEHQWENITGRLMNEYDIRIVTAFHNHESRKENLKKYGIKYHQIHFTNNKEKAEVVAKLNPIAIFEDCPDHINKLSELLPNSIIFVPKYWNYTRHVKDRKNVIMYNDILEIEKDYLRKN